MTSISDLKQIQAALHEHPLAQDRSISVPPGWAPIVTEMFTKIVTIPKIYWPEIHYIKEKYASLVVSHSWERDPVVSDGDLSAGMSEHLNHRALVKSAIGYADGKAKRTCQFCGRRGREREVDGWYAVLCNDHYHHFNSGKHRLDLVEYGYDDPTPTYFVDVTDIGDGLNVIYVELYTAMSVKSTRLEPAYIQGLFDGAILLVTDSSAFHAITGLIGLPLIDTLNQLAQAANIDISADLARLGDKPDGKAVSRIWRKTQGLKV